MRVYGKRAPGEVYRVTEFVHPWTPAVAELAAGLARQADFVAACLDWVRANIVYEPQEGLTDYWQFAEETLEFRTGDCEDMAVLLCSLLRTRLAEHEVFVTIGRLNGEGHAWVYCRGVVLDSAPVGGSGMYHEVNPYVPHFRFNDRLYRQV